jgi:hypothetical protein
MTVNQTNGAKRRNKNKALSEESQQMMLKLKRIKQEKKTTGRKSRQKIFSKCQSRQGQ